VSTVPRNTFSNGLPVNKFLFVSLSSRSIRLLGAGILLAARG
jgi:hypothetical protein